MKKIELKRIFMSLQEQMTTKLKANRAIINHPGTKGDSLEINWIEWMRVYLPKRYSVDKAFVIDCNSNLSEQIDIVIYDRQYSPFVFNQDGAIYIPAESVYAVFEVKPELSKEYIEYAGKKAESVRNLHRTSIAIPYVVGSYPPKQLSKILAGILSVSSNWNPPLGKSFEESIKMLNRIQELDLGCALESGSFMVTYNNENISYDDVVIERSLTEEALIFFFLKLLIELQKKATVPAIDINCYASVLDSFKD